MIWVCIDYDSNRVWDARSKRLPIIGSAQLSTRVTPPSDPTIHEQVHVVQKYDGRKQKNPPPRHR